MMLTEVEVNILTNRGSDLAFEGFSQVRRASHVKDHSSLAYFDKVKNVKALDYPFYAGHEQRLQFIVPNITR